MAKKLKAGWFSFSCCEDSTIVFTELLNDHFDEWTRLVEFKSINVLKKKSEIKGIDVAFVEGAIATKKDEDKLKKIRKNSKRLVAIGSCAVTGRPSGQRNNFSPELKKEIEQALKEYKLKKKVRKLEEVVKVDASVPGCPMVESIFIETLNKYLKEFKVVK